MNIKGVETIANFDEIVTAADAIMIARGGLGVQIPICLEDESHDAMPETLLMKIFKV
jgi:hypothetical protein